jgi:hypothetical protein
MCAVKNQPRLLVAILAQSNAAKHERNLRIWSSSTIQLFL